MKQSALDLLQHYRAASRSLIDLGTHTHCVIFEKSGSKFRAARLALLHSAMFHEHTLVRQFLPSCEVKNQSALIRNVGNFFASIIPATGTGKKRTRGADCLVKSVEISRLEKVEAILRKSHRDALEAPNKAGINTKSPARNMIERMELIGGKFDTESESGKGTKITACIPINKATERRWQNGTVVT